jgi:hypothetical protein
MNDAYVKAVESLREPQLVPEQILSATSLSTARSILENAVSHLETAGHCTCTREANHNIRVAHELVQFFCDMVNRARPLL